MKTGMDQHVEALNKFAQIDDRDWEAKVEFLQRDWDAVCEILGPQRIREELLPCLRAAVQAALVDIGTDLELLFIDAAIDAAQRSARCVGENDHVGVILEILLLIADSSDAALEAKAFDACIHVVLESLPESLEAFVNLSSASLVSDSLALPLVSSRLCVPLLAPENRKKTPREMTAVVLQGLLDALRSARAKEQKIAMETTPGVVTLLLEQIAQKSDSGLLQSPSEIVSANNLQNNYAEQITPSFSVADCIGKIITAVIGAIDDERENIKLSAVAAIVDLLVVLKRYRSMKQIPVEEHFTKLEQCLEPLSSDVSWMVRYTLTKLMAEKQPLGVAAAITFTIPFIADNNPEVQLAALRALTDLVVTAEGIKALAEATGLLEHIKMALMTALASSSKEIRDELADLLMPIASAFGTKSAIRCLFGVFLRLLRDNSYEVRLKAIVSLIPKSQRIVVPGGDLLEPSGGMESAGAQKQEYTLSSEVQLLYLRGVNTAGVVSLATAMGPILVEAEWRTRREALLACASFVNIVAESSQVHGIFCDAILERLADDVHQVRTAAAAALGRILPAASSTWLNETLKSRLDTLSKSSYYGLRISSLYAIQACLISASQAENRDYSSLTQDLKKFLLKYASDPVSNVRFAALKVATELCATKNLKADCYEAATAVISKHSQDTDPAISELRMKFFRRNATGGSTLTTQTVKS